MLATLAWQPKGQTGPISAEQSCSLRSPDCSAEMALFILPYKVGRMSFAICPPCRGAVCADTHAPLDPREGEIAQLLANAAADLFRPRPGERARPPTQRAADLAPNGSESCSSLLPSRVYASCQSLLTSSSAAIYWRRVRGVLRRRGAESRAKSASAR